jgi:hypothetical protein
MKKHISITACRLAILITERGYEPGIPLEIAGEEQLVTAIEIRGVRWYSGDHHLTRGQQEKLTERAYAIIEKDRQPRPATKISIRDCQKAIGIAGGIRISLSWGSSLPRHSFVSRKAMAVLNVSSGRSRSNCCGPGTSSPYRNWLGHWRSFARFTTSTG